MQGTVTQPQCPVIVKCEVIRCPAYDGRQGRYSQRLKCVWGLENALKLRQEIVGMPKDTCPKHQLLKYQRLKSRNNFDADKSVSRGLAKTYGQRGLLPKKRARNRRQNANEWFLVADPPYPFPPVDRAKLERQHIYTIPAGKGR